MTTTDSSKATTVTKVSEDKSDDVLDNIIEIIKDKLIEAEVKKEIKEKEFPASDKVKMIPKLVFTA